MAMNYGKYSDFLKEIHHLNCSTHIHPITGEEIAASNAAKNRLLEIICVSPSIPKNDNEFKKFLIFLLSQFESDTETLIANKHFQLGNIDSSFVKDNNCISAFYGMKSSLISIIRMYMLLLDV